MKTMLTKNWDDSVEERIQMDPLFRQVLLREIVTNLLEGEVEAERSMLRRFITATTGFPQLERVLEREPGSLSTAFDVSGKLLAADLFAVIAYLEKQEGQSFEVFQRAA